MASLVKRLPAPYDFGWTFRTADDCEVVETHLGDGRYEIRLDHAPLKGVTTEMLTWWFQVFDGTATYRGQSLPAYHLWHPRDHVAVKLTRNEAGRVAPKERVHIQEVFGRDKRFSIDARSGIHRWDGRGVGLHLDVAGHRLLELDHVFKDSPNGAIYQSCMRAGGGVGPLRRIINTAVLPRRFGAAQRAAWIRHNFEEVGCFEHFLPELFETKAITPSSAS
ncbi:hypothetical protein NBRC116588_29700 [Pyruvatibacter sp. HU-CL02332]|uniref:DAPG hydrolase family protein n=1 Tax=Pyruvatibacter sp. HU-CL02332 TaxID=3127650 RepID=UPI003107F5A5